MKESTSQKDMYHFGVLLFISDASTTTISWIIAGVLRGNGLDSDLSFVFGSSILLVPYALVLLAIVAIVFFSLSINNSRSPNLLGVGTEEYKYCFSGIAGAAIFVILISFFGNSNLSRMLVLIGFFLNLILVLLGRHFVRLKLISFRKNGKALERALIVGSLQSVRSVVQQLSMRPEVGLTPAGFLTSHEDLKNSISLPSFVGTSNSEILNAVLNTKASVLLITNTSDIDPVQLRELSWLIEENEIALVISPGILDVAGPRLKTRQIPGLPLIQVDAPKFEGIARIYKRIFDVNVSCILMLVLFPIFVIISLIIFVEDHGQPFFVQTRVGYKGSTFKMYKFRSMKPDHEQNVFDVPQDAGNHILFKSKNDPRITRVGIVLRKWSLDELPQILNVLAGNMSLIGPRPPLPREVEQYDGHVHRKFLVRPGITGLWQVSGRSDLSWEESVRLDLSYVDDWSLWLDLVILLKTVRAVLRRDGAY